MLRKAIVLAVLLGVGVGLQQEAQAEASPWPLQLEMRVPFEPTAFPSNGRTYLAYELNLANYTSNPLDLSRIEVLDADAKAAQSIATFEGKELEALLQPVGGSQADSGVPTRLPGGSSLLVYMWVRFEPGAHVPNKLRHRVVTVDATAEGAVIGTHHTKLNVLGSPVKGSNWLASDAPSNDQDNHHRRGIFIFDGHALISRRYAIDWMQLEDGASFSGDARDNRSYYAYGKPVVAVADATVVTATDGRPENVPGHNEEFKPAVPITPETIAGNTITLDLGGGQFAYYLHLQPGSLRVKVGNHVKRGQLLARIGASGDAREPHLHFQITNSASMLGGEGLPYLIDRYRVKSGNEWDTHTRELPMKDMVIDFGQ